MIKAANLSRIRIMDFFLVVSNIKDYTKKEDLETLKLKDFFEQKYIPTFEAFDASLIPNVQKELTTHIRSLNNQRAMYLVGLNSHLRALRNFPDKKVAEAANRLRSIIDSFGKNIHNMPLAEGMAIVINILQEIEKSTYINDIAITGVGKWITEIRKINDQLHTSFKERINKQASVKAGKTTEMRDVMQKVFTEFCNRINAIVTLEGDTLYRTLIDNINREIDRVKQIKKQQDTISKTTNASKIPNEEKQS